jgi:hypothetical protein
MTSCHFSEEAAARPRLKLLPRSVKDPVNSLAETLQKQSVFGNAKPREEVLAEQVMILAITFFNFVKFLSQIYGLNSKRQKMNLIIAEPNSYNWLHRKATFLR